MFHKRLMMGIALLLAISAVLLASPQPKLASAADGGWSTPVNVSHSPSYDNAPDITASANGAAMITWGRAEGSGCDGHGYIMEAANDPLGDEFSAGQLDEACVAANGNIRIRHDAAGRRHVVYWQSD